MNVRIYVQHLVYQLDYYDGPLEEKTINPEVIVELDEDEEEIIKLYEEVLKGNGLR